MLAEELLRPPPSRPSENDIRGDQTGAASPENAVQDSRCSQESDQLPPTISPVREEDLPKSSFDGSHLHWKEFRRDVLAAHRICILEGPPSHPLPESFIALIGASQSDIGKFQLQRTKFQEQVSQGRGFGPSPLFPPNLLPSIEHEPKLARCMVPSFNRDALPERTMNHSGPYYEISKPRSGLGCGFSTEAFTPQEISRIPTHLLASGTVVCFETAYIGPGASFYCPFLVFERTFGQKEQRLEAANNQCAIAGAWCTRGLQMLYAQAWSPSNKDRPDLPVSFSCTIDNDIAIINYHWIDGSQAYCMSPVCKFDLGNADHFNQFNLWIEAIGQWGVRTLLPVLKSALASLRDPENSEVSLSSPAEKPDLKIDTVLQEDKLVTALKDSFSSIPWRLEDDDFTPVSSSVASWGSPIINDFFYSSAAFPAGPSSSSGHSSATSGNSSSHIEARSAQNTGAVRRAKVQGPLRRFNVATPLTPTALSFTPAHMSSGTRTPPPSYAAPLADLASQKRLNHAMDEIKELHTTVEKLHQEVDAMAASHQQEISGLRNIVNTLLHKVVMLNNEEGSVGKSQSLPDSSNVTTLTCASPTAKDVAMDLQQARQLSQAAVVTTPTDPKPRGYPWERAKPQRLRSSLQQVMTINTSGSSNCSSPSCEANSSESETDVTESVVKTSHTDTKPVLTEVPIANSGVKSAPGTAKFLRFPLTPGPLSAAFPSPAFSVRSDGTNFVVVPPPPPRTVDILKWTTALLGAQTLGLLISSTVIRVAVLGCITDFALLAFASPHWPSTTRYFIELLKG